MSLGEARGFVGRRRRRRTGEAGHAVALVAGAAAGALLGLGIQGAFGGGHPADAAAATPAILAVLGGAAAWIAAALRDLEARMGSLLPGPLSQPGAVREMGELVGTLDALTADFRENAAELERFVRQFSTLSELTEITASVPDVETLLRLVLKRAMTATQARRGTLMLLAPDGRTLQVVAAEGWEPEYRTVDVNTTLAAHVVRTGEPLLVEDIGRATLVGRPNQAETYSSPSFVIMPLKARNETLGVVCLAEKATGASFQPHDQQFLAALLAQIGFAVENARLLHQARRAARLLRERVESQQVELEEAARRLLHREKLSALGQLAGGIAHDFNNLVQAVRGHTELALESIPAESPAREDLRQVLAAVERAAGLTRQLLAAGSRQVLETEELDLNACVLGLAEMLERVIGDHIELEVVPGEIPGVVIADPRQIEQVLLNLCLNARDAMPGGGRLTLRTAALAVETGSEGEARREAVVYVSDTGCGMDADTVAKIFEPFFTTKAPGQGTGLGLATAYGIVQQHGGSIEVVSEPGRGTVFSVHLPLFDPASREEKEGPETP